MLTHLYISRANNNHHYLGNDFLLSKLSIFCSCIIFMSPFPGYPENGQGTKIYMRSITTLIFPTVKVARVTKKTRGETVAEPCAYNICMIRCLYNIMYRLGGDCQSFRTECRRHRHNYSCLRLSATGSPPINLYGDRDGIYINIIVCAANGFGRLENIRNNNNTIRTSSAGATTATILIS